MTTKGPSKDQRYRERCFPGAESEVFNPKNAGFAPLPIISRVLLRHLTGAALKVWIYMLTRGGPASICYPTYEAIMADTGVETKGTVSKAIKRLLQIGLIKMSNDRGTRRYLLRDPRLAVERLFELGEVDPVELEDANFLLEQIGRPLIVAKPKAVPVPIKKSA